MVIPMPTPPSLLSCPIDRRRNSRDVMRGHSISRARSGLQTSFMPWIVGVGGSARIGSVMLVSSVRCRQHAQLHGRTPPSSNAS